jgi:hypothetical protein
MKSKLQPPTAQEWRAANPKQAAKLTKSMVKMAIKALKNR